MQFVNHRKSDDNMLDQLVKQAQERYDKMSSEEQEAMWKAQRESWVRGMKPTGDPRFD